MVFLPEAPADTLDELLAPALTDLLELELDFHDVLQDPLLNP